MQQDFAIVNVSVNLRVVLQLNIYGKLETYASTIVRMFEV
jgi:hypothetical protein